jgi:hypothetical protein
MRKITKLSAAAALVVAAGIALSPTLRAQETSGSASPPRPGMMERMSQMMDQCSRMMQSADNSKKAPAPGPDSK